MPRQMVTPVTLGHRIVTPSMLSAHLYWDPGFARDGIMQSPPITSIFSSFPDFSIFSVFSVFSIFCTVFIPVAHTREIVLVPFVSGNKSAPFRMACFGLNAECLMIPPPPLIRPVYLPGESMCQWARVTGRSKAWKRARRASRRKLSPNSHFPLPTFPAGRGPCIAGRSQNGPEESVWSPTSKRSTNLPLPRPPSIISIISLE